MLFFNFDCSECLDLGSSFNIYLGMLRCYAKNISPEVNTSYDDIAIAVRQGEHVSVIISRDGNLQVMPYAQFLAMPFFSDLTYRKIHVSDSDDDFRRLFIQRVKLLYHQIATKDHHLAYFSSANQRQYSKTPLVNIYLKELKLVPPTRADQVTVADLDSQRPNVFLPGISLDKKVVIRSEKNNELRRGQN